MPTRRPTRSPAGSNAATTVAVAQPAGQVTSSGKAAGSRTMLVPGSSRQCEPSPPSGSRPSASLAWPYFTPLRHFCGRPRRQRSHAPQEATTAQTTRSPTATGPPSTAVTGPAPPTGPSATMRPVISWPSTVGTATSRRPVKLCRSLPQRVQPSTSTSTSPSRSVGQPTCRSRTCCGASNTATVIGRAVSAITGALSLGRLVMPAVATATSPSLSRPRCQRRCMLTDPREMHHRVPPTSRRIHRTHC